MVMGSSIGKLARSKFSRIKTVAKKTAKYAGLAVAGAGVGALGYSVAKRYLGGRKKGGRSLLTQVKRLALRVKKEQLKKKLFREQLKVVA